MRLNIQKLSELGNSDFTVIILFGPTAVGKTEVIYNCFSKGFEVINADSIQVYEKLDIGSAKPELSVLNRIPHHLINVIPADGMWTVEDFITNADKLVCEISNRKNKPLISGGTAFYIKHYLYGLSNAPKSEEITRKYVSDMIKRIGLKEVYNKLTEIDPVSANNINENDAYRISRALEVYYDSGKPLSSFPIPRIYRDGIKPYIIGLRRDKEELRKRIKLRVDEMFKNGLVDEVNALRKMGANLTWQSMRAIGYREFFTCSEKSLDEIKEQIILDTIHYAKRQTTFFNSFSDVHFIDLD